MSFSIVAAALLVAVLLWTWRIVKWAWIKPKMMESYLRRQGLAGTPYTPLVGDMKRNINMLMEARSKPMNLTDDITPRLLPLALKMLNTHGKTFFIWIGPVPAVMITNPEHIKQVFNKVYDFEKAATFPLVRLLASGVASYEGDKWANHRRIINPAFHLKKIKNMVPAFYHCCSEVVCQWESLVSDKESPCEVDVWPWLVNLTADVISHTSFGSSYKEGQRIFQLQGELAELIAQAFKKSYIPGLRFYPTKSNRRMKAIDREIDIILRGIISKREKAREAGEAANDDLLGILLESNSDESQRNGMSVEEVMKECKLFYFAGQETTSVLLVWTMVLLSHNQDWQAKAREEVMQALGGNNNKPEIDSLSNLKVVSKPSITFSCIHSYQQSHEVLIFKQMTMIFNEVLRLYPPVALLKRAVNKEMKLGELTLPPGVQVYIPTALVHRDRELWGDDAAEFKPERFREGLSKATKNQVSFFPFGWGPRICIGQSFALLEAKMAMTLILQRFSFELSPSYVHAPQTVMTTRPQFGAHLILHKL
ncbi:cytochrome P450 72A13-like isoform X1 [Raphanus sativus]|uniref:Cytochrome P450 72A13-like isoform X1 n=1 Tax=Raphanus sativus TaxID=3726 RepID=A0A6J0P262_RAPSA|nr:cytochrome P450 72A13-like isoform X1 [Raphanus sativus]